MKLSKTSNRSGRRVVIVGAGPGGLASGMLLAAAGFQVTILERRDCVGGRTSTLEAHGFRFDLGPTFFLYPEILRSIFEMCGRSLDETVELIKLDPHYCLRFEQGGELRATSDIPRLEREIASVSPSDAKGVRAYMEDNRRKLNGFKPILQSPFNDLRDLLRHPLHRLLPLMRPWASVDRDLRKFFKDPRIRLAFSFQSKYLGMSPFQCPSLFTILSFLEYEYGVFHPRGGCGAVTQAMARTARELGTAVRLNESVEEIAFDGRRPVGVKTNVGEYSCDALVINADFAHTMERLVPDHLRRRWTNQKLAKKRYSCSTYMMYLGLDGHEGDLDHHTIFLAQDYEQNLRDIETRHELSENPSFYVQNPCVTDSTMAPPGRTSLYVLVPVTHLHPNVNWSQERHRFRRLVLQQLGKIGVPDIEKRIRFEKILTPVNWMSDLHIYRGATFNLTHSLDQMLHRRPRNRFEDLEKVYLVGGGTHPGSGLPVIFESARISSRLLAEDFGVTDAWDIPGCEKTAGPEIVSAQNMASVT